MEPAQVTGPPEGVRLRGAVAFAGLLAVLLGGTILETWGIGLPRIGGLPGPLAQPETLAAIGIAAACLRRRPGAADAPPGLGLLDLAPLALAVVGVRAMLDEAWPLLRRWTTPPAVPADLSAPLLRLGMGGALLAGLLLLAGLVPAFRARFGVSASGRRLRSGLYFTVAVVAVVYAVLLVLGLAVAGPGQLRLQVPRLLPATITLVFGQAVIAFGEEALYRGVLQGETARLLVRAGLRGARAPRVAALLAVSALFAFQHVGPGMAPGAFAATLAYAFAMSLLFGVMFELTGNLAVCSLAHLFNNLTVLGLGPKLAAPGQIEAFGSGVYVAAYLLVAFSLLFLLGQEKDASLAPIRPR